VRRRLVEIATGVRHERLQTLSRVSPVHGQIRHLLTGRTCQRISMQEKPILLLHHNRCSGLSQCV
jgi:hypothetical protein